jgi:hypothetical protein
MNLETTGEANIKTSESTPKKIQFEFSPDALKRLEHLKTQVDASTKAEVVRNALKIYEWLVTEIDPNYTLEIQDEEGKPVFRIPAKVLLS